MANVVVTLKKSLIGSKKDQIARGKWQCDVYSITRFSNSRKYVE